MIPPTLRPATPPRNRFRPARLLGLAATGLWLIAGPAPADIQQVPPGRGEDKEKDPRQENIRRAAEIPTPQDAQISVLRGVPTRIVLSSTAALRQPVLFRLGDRPAHGALSEPRPSAESNTKAVVTYTAGPGTAESDSFTFRVKHRDTPTSGSATVRIRIIDPKAELAAPEVLDFGEAIVGETTVRPLVLENKGTAAFAGVLKLDPPWRLLQDLPEVRVEPGARLEVQLGFAPVAPGDSAYTLEFPGLETPRTRLAGRAIAPIQLQPSLVQLAWDPEARVRKATTTVSNRLTTPVEYALASSPRLQFSQERGTLPAGGSAEVTVLMPLPDVGDLQTLVTATASGVRTEVPLTAPPPPALVALASADGWEKDGEVLRLPAGTTEGNLVFTNEGGEAAALTVALPDGWTSPGLEDAATLGPGETRRVLLIPPATPAAAAPGPLRARLQDHQVVLRLAASTAAPSPKDEAIGPDALLTAVPTALAEAGGRRDLTSEEKRHQLMIDTLGVFPSDTRFDRSLPELDAITVARMKPEQVDMMLKSPGAQYTIMVFRDQYRPPPGGVRPTRHWLPVEGLKWKSTGNSVSTTLKGLLPGGRVLLRFAVRTPDGRVGPPSVAIAITTPVPSSRRWPWVLGGVAVVGLGWWWRRRQRGD